MSALLQLYLHVLLIVIVKQVKDIEKSITICKRFACIRYEQCELNIV